VALDSTWRASVPVPTLPKPLFLGTAIPTELRVQAEQAVRAVVPSQVTRRFRLMDSRRSDGSVPSPEKSYRYVAKPDSQLTIVPVSRTWPVHGVR
jgi:hypothetical protein